MERPIPMSKGDTDMATTLTRDQVEERMADAVVQFGPEREQITRDATFESLDVDSLDLAELSQIVEDEYGVKIDDDDMPKLKTFGDAVDFIVEGSG
jgi:acyl carrier protein